MNRILLALLPFALTTAAFAIDVDPRLDRAVRESLPVCAGSTISYLEIPLKLPTGFKGALVRVESPSHSCDGQYLGVLAPTGSTFVGVPWVIARAEGETIEERLKNFAWKNFQSNMVASVERKPNDDGLYPVTLTQMIESGKMPVQGVVDPQGNIFFFGHFRRGGVRAARAKAIEAILGTAPSRGPANASVTVVEFSDFQCPACKRTAGLADTLLDRFGGKVRYVRSDLPLSGHPWAFPASVAGRAISRQNPELFWAYKKQIYDNQESLNPFVIWDFVRAFAADNSLDLARYDADVASEELNREILTAAGVAFSNDIASTPSFMVNGALVSSGELVEYVESLLKSSAGASTP